MRRCSLLFTVTFTAFLSGCVPKPPTVILHNSCPGYTSLRNISFPPAYVKSRLDSLGFTDSLGKPDTGSKYSIDSRIFIHPEDELWLDRLDSIFPEARHVKGQTKGVVDIQVGMNGLSFDSVPFSRKVLVLNGTSKEGLARDAAYNFSIKFGLAPLEPQSADSDTFTQTVLYCSSDAVALAERLIEFLGAGRVETRKNLIDLVVVLGSDVLDASKIKSSPGGISVVIKKSLFKLFLYKNGQLVKTYPVALGKNAGDKQRVGDCRTPEGDFTVTSIEDSHTWEHDFADDTLGPIKGAYGPWFFRLSTLASETKSGKAWTGIAIHGTHDRASIGTRASEGCIRLYNEDVDSLKRIVKVGTPVRIEE